MEEGSGSQESKRDLSGGPLAKAPCSRCRALKFDPWAGNQIPPKAIKDRRYYVPQQRLSATEDIDIYFKIKSQRRQRDKRSMICLRRNVMCCGKNLAHYCWLTRWREKLHACESGQPQKMKRASKWILPWSF